MDSEISDRDDSTYYFLILRLRPSPLLIACYASGDLVNRRVHLIARDIGVGSYLASSAATTVTVIRRYRLRRLLD